MTHPKRLSSPLCTGSAGPNFEAQVQASFVALMLSGGHAPCLPSWPITQIKLQGKIDGFDTDDLVVFVNDSNTNERRKLLAQIKRSVSIRLGDRELGEVMQAAWSDFNNARLYTKGKDQIALITGPLNATDARVLPWLLNHARSTNTPDEFYRDVNTALFSPTESVSKLETIRHHLKIANGGVKVPDALLYDFLKNYHILGYDLGNEYGVILSLLQSLIAQFETLDSKLVWARIVDIVHIRNQHSGTLTRENLPEDLRKAFTRKTVTAFPWQLKKSRPVALPALATKSDETTLALLTLVGAWNENCVGDTQAIRSLLNLSEMDFLETIRNILLLPDTPLVSCNGSWSVSHRHQLWQCLAKQLLDNDLRRFTNIIADIFKVHRTAPPTRDTLAVWSTPSSDSFGFSLPFRQGVIDGLALMATHFDVCSNCSHNTGSSLASDVVSTILDSADANHWARLNHFLPGMAEAHPRSFLSAVEAALQASPSPIDVLFLQEHKHPHGPSYLSGLLWALEILAWNDEFFMRVCLILGDLANRDPGGKWLNRPSNSLTTILLPWCPQTLATSEKRTRALEALLREFPGVGWNLIIALLPGNISTTTGTQKPKWDDTVADDWKPNVPEQEYREQIAFLGERAVEIAATDSLKLCLLIERCDTLAETAFLKLMDLLTSSDIISLPEVTRMPIWKSLEKVIRRNRRHPDAAWVMPTDLLSQLVDCASGLTPTDPFNEYQYLFSENDLDLFDDEMSNWETQLLKLRDLRITAIERLSREQGLVSIVRFAETVTNAYQVGFVLGSSDARATAEMLITNLIDSELKTHVDLLRGYTSARIQQDGWKWCDLVHDTSWTITQTARFLSCLPFTSETWKRVTNWLPNNEEAYWASASVNPFDASDDIDVAVAKLITVNRPYEAIACLDTMRHRRMPLPLEMCLEALRDSANYPKKYDHNQSHQIVELIEYLQNNPSVTEDNRLQIERAWLHELDRIQGAAPITMERRLANDPLFFHDMITKVFRSTEKARHEDEESSETASQASRIRKLLHTWATPPGTTSDGTLDGMRFTEWIARVTELCAQSGHFTVGLITAGEVLIHAPGDPDGLWIHRAVAAALNKREANDLRRGYRTAAYNSRGVHFVDPSGAPERELAAKYRRKADAVEKAGFTRFAETLRSLANDYEAEANDRMNDPGLHGSRG
jgi:hypothetical protein